ncbi:hypothetical protein ACLOJK_026243 [Asimina triloba]
MATKRSNILARKRTLINISELNTAIYGRIILSKKIVAQEDLLEPRQENDDGAADAEVGGILGYFRFRLKGSRRNGGRRHCAVDDAACGW